MEQFYSFLLRNKVIDSACEIPWVTEGKYMFQSGEKIGKEVP